MDNKERGSTQEPKKENLNLFMETNNWTANSALLPSIYKNDETLDA